MIIKRVESIGMYWLDEVAQLQSRGSNAVLNPIWEKEREGI